MQNRREKQRTVALAAAGLVGLVLLAAALGSFAFAIPFGSLSESLAGNRAVFSQRTALGLFLAWLILVALPSIFLMVTSRQYRRWMLSTLLISLLLLYAIAIMSRLPLLSEESAMNRATREAMLEAMSTPQPALSPGAGTTQVLVWLLSIGLAGLVLTLAVTAYFYAGASRVRKVSPLEIIAASAETALQALELGNDVRGAILRCYASMLAAASERGADRPGYLTPAEFIKRLVQAGLPSSEVERLTHLFEAVRYSLQPPTEAMEAEAVACLQVVVRAARAM